MFEPPPFFFLVWIFSNRSICNQSLAGCFLDHDYYFYYYKPYFETTLPSACIHTPQPQPQPQRSSLLAHPTRILPAPHLILRKKRIPHSEKSHTELIYPLRAPLFILKFLRNPFPLHNPRGFFAVMEVGVLGYWLWNAGARVRVCGSQICFSSLKISVCVRLRSNRLVDGRWTLDNSWRCRGVRRDWGGIGMGGRV